MGLKVPEPGAAPRHCMAFCDSGREAGHNRCGCAIALWTPHRPQEKPSVRRGHIAVHTGPHRTTSSPQSRSHHTRHAPDKLLKGFTGLAKPTGNHREVRQNTTHHIRTTPGPPVACRPPRLAPDLLAVAKAEFDAMLKDGTARRAEGL